MPTTVLDPSTASELHTLYVFGSLELRRTDYQVGSAEYTRDDRVEAVYLVANGVKLGKVVSPNAGVPAPQSGVPVVLLTIGDMLGSSSVVIDRASGELVENRGYRAYGDEEHDYRTSRWANLPEEYGFTGKEADVEVGLTYFGKRFLVPSLGRWLNVDPLALHSPGSADANLYAYVSGRVFTSVDPFGLADAAAEKDKGWLEQTSDALKGARNSASAAAVGVYTGVVQSFGEWQLGTAVVGRDPMEELKKAAADHYESPRAAEGGQAVGLVAGGLANAYRGAAQTGAGGAAGATGVAATAGSGGSASPVSVPLTAVGTLVFVDGVVAAVGAANAVSAAVGKLYHLAAGGGQSGPPARSGVGKGQDGLENRGAPWSEGKPLRPEPKYLRGGKHGIEWNEGAAEAKKNGPQGQWGSKADLDYAGEKAATLKPGEGAKFPVPEGSKSVVHKRDGTTARAKEFWVRNNGTGTFHGYPTE